MKIKKSRLVEIVNEELTKFLTENVDMGLAQSGEESSIQTSLHMIQEYSSKLAQIQDQVQWEDWMQDKLTLASRDLDSIYHKFEGDLGGKELASPNLRNARISDLPSINEQNDVTKHEELDSLAYVSSQLRKMANTKGEQIFSEEQLQELKMINQKLVQIRSDVEANLDRVDEALQEDKEEDIVQNMKKNIQSFKDRYGDEWKNVMYATANKLAKD